MAPPNKRRRLSIWRSESLPSRGDLLPDEPTPTLLHSVEHLEHKSTSPTAHTVPKRIEEIHLQIQERGLIKKNKPHQPLYRRQGATAVTSLITTIDDLGNTIVTEITIGATTTTPTSPADSNTTNSDSNTDTDTDTSGSPTSASSSTPSLSITPGSSSKCSSSLSLYHLLTSAKTTARAPLARPRIPPTKLQRIRIGRLQLQVSTQQYCPITIQSLLHGPRSRT